MTPFLSSKKKKKFQVINLFFWPTFLHFSLASFLPSFHFNGTSSHTLVLLLPWGPDGQVTTILCFSWGVVSPLHLQSAHGSCKANEGGWHSRHPASRGGTNKAIRSRSKFILKRVDYQQFPLLETK